MLQTKNAATLSKSPQTTPNSIIEHNIDETDRNKVQHIWVTRYSERETSRYIAAICDILLQSLERDFNIESPKTVIIEAPDHGGIRIKING
jgi:hypothetical protein